MALAKCVSGKIPVVIDKKIGDFSSCTYKNHNQVIANNLNEHYNLSESNLPPFDKHSDSIVIYSEGSCFKVFLSSYLFYR